MILKGCTLEKCKARKVVCLALELICNSRGQRLFAILKEGEDFSIPAQGAVDRFKSVEGSDDLSPFITLFGYGLVDLT